MVTDSDFEVRVINREVIVRGGFVAGVWQCSKILVLFLLSCLGLALSDSSFSMPTTTLPEE